MNYLDINQVLAIHSEVIRQTGGSGGTRDLGLLDSAVARPKATFGGEYDLKASEDEKYKFVMEIAEKKKDEKSIAKWLKKHSQRIN